MYDAVADSAFYPGTEILKNIPDLRSQAALDRFEAISTARRFLEPMPTGQWSVSHYRAIHRHIFQDVYRWAGQLRRVRISKGGSVFCYPEHIPKELHRVFHELRRVGYLCDLDQTGFTVRATHFLADLNAVHPFRDGNGRSQLTFLTLLAAHAQHPLNLIRLEPVAFLKAMIASFDGDEMPLRQQIAALL